MDTKEELIKQSVRGDNLAQRQLYDQYRQKWFMVCLRYGKNKKESEDILQEGLIQVFKDLHQYDAKRSKFVTWSCRVMAHAALRYLKNNNWHRTFLDIDSVELPVGKEGEIYSQIAAKELTMLIQELPMGYRIVFNMYVIEGYSHKEIAKKLGIQIGTSKSQLFKAKKELRRKLESQLTK